MRRVGIVGLLLVVGLLGSAAPGSASEPQTDESSERRSLELLNGERTERGKQTLRWSSDLASVARAHSEDMAESGELRHNGRLGEQVSDWSELAENVGTGPSADAIHNAFMGSDDHRANILGSFVEIGIGAVVDEGQVWLTQVFRTPEEAAPVRRKPRETTRTPVRTTRTVFAPRTFPARPLPTLPAKAKPEPLRAVAFLERLNDDYEPVTVLRCGRMAC